MKKERCEWKSRWREKKRHGQGGIFSLILFLKLSIGQGMVDVAGEVDRPGLRRRWAP